MERKPEDARVSPLLDPDEVLLWWSAPDARGLFLANLAGLLVNLLWACATAAALVFASLNPSNGSFLACGVFLLVTVSSVWRAARIAFGARHIFYAITDRRILSCDDREAAPFVIFRRYTGNRERDAWLDGMAICGRRHGARATVRIPYRAFMVGTIRTSDGVKRAWFHLTSVERPDEAIRVLNEGVRG